ncbi:GbsR/MarR family transcriptional regulator [Halorussus salinus]|uniref:GbsR/MarR family transcriptional regulator n=1 Tax=Halorussus salinus TaxID=1364935 RepID=UPI00109260DC|nr:transcriptional regulator [Halorussus salinus]
MTDSDGDAAETDGPSDTAPEANTGTESGTPADSDATERAREEVVEAMARAAEVYGIKPSYGRLYGLLYFAEEPLSLDELVAESDYAKSTVSTAMSALERYHFVHRRSIPGEGKKAYFEADTDFWYVFQQLLNQEVRSEVKIMTRALDEAAQTLREADSERADRDLEKVERLLAVYEKGDTALGVLTSSSFDQIMSVLGRFRSRE